MARRLGHIRLCADPPHNFGERVMGIRGTCPLPAYGAIGTESQTSVV
jgi:hypothetical protein